MECAFIIEKKFNNPFRKKALSYVLGASLKALLPFSQPDNQLSGLAGESDVATHRKPKLIQPLTTDNQLWAGVRALSVGQVAHCILP